jgi:hypothetical protein
MKLRLHHALFTLTVASLPGCPPRDGDGNGGPDLGSLRLDGSSTPNPGPADAAQPGANDLAVAPGPADLAQSLPPPDMTMGPPPADMAQVQHPADMAHQINPDMAQVQIPADMAHQINPDMAQVQIPPDMAHQINPDMAQRPADMAQRPPDLAQNPDLAQRPADMAQGGGNGVDPFGVREIYSTANGGREWFLPANADQSGGEWQPNTQVTKISAGVFSVSGAPRMMVVSTAGKAWWRNVEMTAYLRQTAVVNFYQDQVPHWEFFARGEEHTNDFIAPKTINLGVPAPQGTVTWPNYPFNGFNTVNHSCLASCYHGHAYPSGKVLFEKEISHTEGYVYGLAQKTVANFADTMNRWFGYKFILRNESKDQHVHMEVWVDKDANGTWALATSADDVGAWNASIPNMNGCGAAPFGYQVNEIITWAGPWVSFRVDNMTYQFKDLSVREIDALP